MMDEQRATVQDAVNLCEYCIPGMRVWARTNGLDFRAFCHEGLPLDVLENTGDEFALQLVRRIREQRQ